MSSPINLSAMTPDQWVDLTKQAIESREGGAQSRKYIVIKPDSTVYLATDLNTIEKGDSKLSLAQITFYSKQIIEKSIKSLEEGPLTPETLEKVQNYKAISHDIIVNAQSLISSKDEKYRFLRTLLCLITLGAALFFIKKSERQLETKMSEMNASTLDTTNRANRLETLAGSVQSAMQKYEEYDLGFDDASKLVSLMESDPSQRERFALIPSAMKEYQLDFDGASKLVELMLECPSQMEGFANPTLIQSVIQGTIDDQWVTNNDLPVDERPAILEQFSKDIRRGVSLKRKDEGLNIEDSDPVPLLSLPRRQRVTDAADAIDEIVKGNEKDQKWATVLQLIATQSSLNGAFFGPRVNLNVPGSEIQWTEATASFALSAEFPDTLPPIEIEIIRNQETSEIEKVNVKVAGGLDLVKKQIGGEGKHENQTLVPDALSVSMSYTVTLGENGAPVLSDLQCEYKASMPYTL